MKLFINTLPLALLLALCAAQDINPVGPEVGPVPETTPVFRPRPIPPNRKQPIITKGDIVIAASERIGVVVDNLAQRLALDLKDILVNLPATPGIGSPGIGAPGVVEPNTVPPEPSSTPNLTQKRVMDGQRGVRELIESER